jgi:predicted Zn-dependent peptidase
MVFKGTRHRSARQIASSLESLGGSLNAFTSREHTCFVARVLADHVEEAVDVLADITCRATFTAANLKREKTVICEEIKESQDTPSDKVHDNFSKAFWGTHPLGQPIMGLQGNVMKATRKEMLGYVSRHYRNGSVVIAAGGAVSHQKLVALARRRFSLPAGTASAAPTAERLRPEKVNAEQTDGFQTHLCLGYPGLPFGDRERMVAMILNSYLGGGMSSVLFQKIREERGLAYSVYCFHDFFRDTGVFGTYVGTDKEHVRRAFDLIMAEFDKLKKRRLAASRLQQVKTQLKGNLTLALETPSARMSRLGRQELMAGRYRSLQELVDQIEAVSAADVTGLANRIFDHGQRSVAILGPVDDKLFDDVA